MDKILQITPAQRCTIRSCHRMTTVAFAEPMSNENDTQFLLSPKCWQHGYNEVSPEEERASVERFVVGYHRGQGTARVLKKVDVNEVPHYRPDNPEHDPFMYIKERCWLVRYTDLEGNRHDVYAVWSFSKLSFLLREQDRLQL